MSEQPPEERAYHHHAHLISKKHEHEQEILTCRNNIEYLQSQRSDYAGADERNRAMERYRLRLKQARELLRVVKSELKSIKSRTSKSEKRPQSRWEFVKPHLDKKGWTKNRWAVIAEVKPSTVQNYLDGRRTYPSTLEKLAKALGIEVAELLI